MDSLSYVKGTTTLYSVNYSYGAAGSNNGQIQSITDNVDNGRSVTYSYDYLARLATAVTTGSTGYPKWGLSFGYDAYGNRLTQSISSGCTGLTCPTNSVVVNNATNRITTTGYGYDANGNMTNDGVNTLTYDAENRLLSSSGSLGSGTYTYDGKGVRVVKVSGSTTTVSIYSGTKVIAEYQNGAAPSSPTNEYMYSGNQIVASIQSGTYYYFHNDRHSLRFRTRSNGGIQDQRGTFPFGETWYVTASGAEWLFTNYQRDNESGNDYVWAREYVNRLGRFATGDPVEVPQTSAPRNFNRYSYVANDPINRTDRTGRLADYCGDPGPANQGLNEDDYGNPIWYPGFGSLGGDDSGNVPSDVQYLYCALPLENNYDNPPPNPCDTLLPDTVINIPTTYPLCGLNVLQYNGDVSLVFPPQRGLYILPDPVDWDVNPYGGVTIFSALESEDFDTFVIYNLPVRPPRKFGIKFSWVWTCNGIPGGAGVNVKFSCK